MKLPDFFGKNLGIVFQIRDDIFDYYDSEAEIGKPTGNDLAEGKLTLPIIYALNSTENEEMNALARKVKAHDVTREEIENWLLLPKIMVELNMQSAGCGTSMQKLRVSLIRM